MLYKMLIRLREKTGLTQKDLATKLGIARTTYSGYENGAREPDLETLKRIADYFDVTLDYLLNGEESKKVILTDTIKIRLNEEFDKLTKEEQENLLTFIERMPKKIK
ncbi:helix-turn-helix domain-containing protein [Paenibacillus sp. HWE-109]|uniref:helix-turn-helix domain-containing protein n=1 Tax=Paenibacillus sp. HWE-109 TaxID=1306526 RepID=UPI001EDF1842|nr:helix-turn-helix transcriptional regulator [Paenibacillus sp. HWE-109]UKS25059.1 helix-turn-helix domain-containing protein [Paenibacillus sp. HWE-109]